MPISPSDSLSSFLIHEITGLVGTLTWRLMDSTGNVVIAASTAGITEGPTGTYRHDYTAPATAGLYQPIWNDGTADLPDSPIVVGAALVPGTPPGAPPSTRVWATYIDFDEATDWLQFNTSPTGAKRTKFQRVIDAVCTWGQDRSNRPLGPTRFQERHDGWSGEYIMLRRSPFLQLIQCREWHSTGGFTDLTESTPENPVEGIQIDYATSRIMRAFAGYSWPRPFFPGSRNIEVTYLAGFNPIPPDIWLATMELIAWWWRNTQEASREQLRGGGSGEYGGAATDGLWPGVPNRIAEVFDSYWLPTVG